MKVLSPWVCAVVGLTFCSGCASIFKGSNSEFKVAGLAPTDTLRTTEGVEIPHDGDTVRMGANDGIHTIVVKTPKGEKPLGLHRFVGAGWVVLDILCGLVPVVVDAASGNWSEYDDVAVPRDIAQPPAPPDAAAAQPGDREAACKAAEEYDRRAASAPDYVKQQLQKMAARKHADCAGGERKP